MNTQYLKYALTVASSGSISEAAKKLYMSQPQLSKAIRELEYSLGVPLFRRTSRGVVPTSKGEKFLVHARNVLEQVDIIENLYRPDSRDKYRLDAAVPRACYIADAFYGYLDKISFDQDVRVDFRETNSQRIIKNVASGENNIGIIRYNTEYEKYFLGFTDEKDLSYELIYEFDCDVLMSKNHPLADTERIDDNMIAGFTKVIFGDLTVPLLPISKVSEILTKLEERKSISVYDRQSLYEILSRFHDCYSLSAPVLPDILERYGLVQRTASLNGSHCKDVLVYRRGYSFTDDDKLFLSIVRQHIANMENK